MSSALIAMLVRLAIAPANSGERVSPLPARIIEAESATNSKGSDAKVRRR